jgi:hypothetical protein
VARLLLGPTGVAPGPAQPQRPRTASCSCSRQVSTTGAACRR